MIAPSICGAPTYSTRHLKKTKKSPPAFGCQINMVRSCSSSTDLHLKAAHLNASCLQFDERDICILNAWKCPNPKSSRFQSGREGRGKKARELKCLNLNALIACKDKKYIYSSWAELYKVWGNWVHLGQKLSWGTPEIMNLSNCLGGRVGCSLIQNDMRD